MIFFFYVFWLHATNNISRTALDSIPNHRWFFIITFAKSKMSRLKSHIFPSGLEISSFQNFTTVQSNVNSYTHQIPLAVHCLPMHWYYVPFSYFLVQKIWNMNCIQIQFFCSSTLIFYGKINLEDYKYSLKKKHFQS